MMGVGVIVAGCLLACLPAGTLLPCRYLASLQVRCLPAGTLPKSRYSLIHHAIIAVSSMFCVLMPTNNLLLS